VHILIEKPIASSLDAADRIVAAADAAGVLVQIGHVERFNAALRACEPYLEEPLFVESHRLAPFNPRGTDVAVVLDLMIHDLDLVLSLMKRPVSALAAVGVPVLTSSVDIANARLEFEGGGVANLTASRISLERMRKIRFFQRSGYISLDLAAGTGEYLRLKPGVAGQLAALGAGGGAHSDGPAGLEALLKAGGGIQDLVERISLSGDGGEPLAHELNSFIAAVRRDAPVPVSGHDGRRALAVALDIVGKIQAHVAH
jgi:predicted dehydrogenase